MSTWILGDVQGCFEELRALVAKLALTSEDRLVFAGDLVNRGPASLDVLRFLASRDPAKTGAVLGNHDLHLLGRAAGTRDAGRRDTFEDVLEAPDRDDLLRWLTAVPFVREESGWLVVHAGCHPDWSGAELLRRGGELSAALVTEPAKTLASLAEPAPSRPREEQTGNDRLRFTAKVVTRIRMLDPDGAVDRDFAGSPDAAPSGYLPWYEAWRPRDDARIVHGHWAALGLLLGDRTIALDTGCVWGSALSAVRLEDRRVVQVPAAERRR